MSKPVAEKGEGRARNYEVYGIIQNMMKEGSANFFKDSRRYRVDWVKALEYYKAYRQRKDPRFNIPRRKLSKDLRSALLSSSYANDGAKEYPSSKKVNNVQEVVERQFQMPFKVFKSLFGNAECSDISEEQDEQGAGKAGSSTDTGYDDNMNITDGPSEPVDLRSLDDPANFETNVPGTYNQDFSFEIQMEDLGDSILKDICSEPEEILETIQGACEIVPVSGPVEGGYPFVISYTERLPDNVSSGMAEFEGVKKVKLKRRNSYTFAGRVPASHQTGRVGVKVTSQCGVWLGRTFFCYVEMEKKRKQLVRDLAQLSSFLSDMSQKYGSFAVDSDIALVPDPPNLQFQGDLDSTIQATQKQSIKILELLVYTAAQTGAKQFIEMIFSTSAQRTVFDSYKDRAQLPEDVARANGHCSLAQYLEDITTRLTKEADDKPKAIDWLELLKAVQNQVSVSQDKESKEETSSVESDYNSSDYFADTETSSCGSSEDDDVFTSNSEGKDVVEKDNEKQNGSSFLEVIHDDVDESFVSGVCVDGAVSRDRYKKKITDVHFPEEENNKHLVTAENAAVKTNNDTASVCHLRKENHRQDLVPKKVYRTCQDPGMHPLPPTLWPCRAEETLSEATKCRGIYESKEEKRALITENVAVSASTCRLKRPGYLGLLSAIKADERQLNQELVIFEKSIGDEPVHSPSTLLPSCSVLSKSPPQSSCSASLHGLFSGNVSWKNESNMKDLKFMARVRSWLRCNPNSEEFPSAEAASQDKESKEETTPADSDDNSSDYFANAETSCGSFEYDDEFTSNPEGKDTAEKDSPTGVSKERLLEDPPYSSIPDANHMEDSKPPDEKQSGSSFLGFFLREDLYFNPVFPPIKKTPLIDLNFNRVLSSIKKTPLIGWIDNSLGFSFGICLSIAEMKAIARKVCGRCCSIVEMKEIAREIFDTVHITVGNSAQFLGGSPSKWINCRELSRYESKQEKRVLMAENVVVSASTCRLKRPGYLVLSPLEADERQLHQEQFIFEKSIDFINNAPPQTDSSASLHGVSSGNVSWKNESSIKELKMARVRSWLSCNPNSEEFPSAEGF